MFKKIALIAITVMLAAGLAGCGGDKKNPADDTPPTEAPSAASSAISDYYPILPDRIMRYTGSATVKAVNEAGEEVDTEVAILADMFNDYIHGDISQQRVISDVEGRQTVSAEVYDASGGKLRLVSAEGGMYDHADMTGEEPFMDILILSEPLREGAEWIRTESGGVTETAKIIGMDEQVTVPYGTFSAMVVEIQRGDEVQREYYAKGLGWVKTELDGPERAQSQELAEVIEGPLREQMPMIYGWHVEVEEGEEDAPQYSMAPMYDIANVTYPTNSDINAIYSDVLRRYAAEKYGMELDEDVKINSLEIDRFTRLLHVDLSRAFLEAMKELGNGEMQALQLIADTLSESYFAYEVTFSVDGEAYVSDNITIDPEQGDFVTPSGYKDAEAYYNDNVNNGE
ncbi:MAG: GerMN domain-containing protein [Clostridiales bacterium]|jgi:hypothetical protein|nr:GerMN domain-containing protein [Clostridiales bacterium]